MQGRGVINPPTGITFDSDFGNNIDSFLTLGFLRAESSKGEARLVGMSISKSNLKAAQAADAITKFYNGPPAPGRFGGVGVNPEIIGLADNGKMAGDTAILNAVVAKKTADGKPAYPSGIARMLDTADCGISTRNILLAQNDLNAIVLVDGPLTGTAELMDLYGARPQLTQKVKFLVVAAGSFPNGADDAIAADVASARKVFAEWPTEIVFAGTEVGEALPYPGSSIMADFTWAASHPIVDAYKAFKPMPYDAPAPGLAAALYAVHPDDGYFKLSEPGTVTVLDDGHTKFTPNAGGKHRYLIADPAQKEKVIRMYTEMVSAKPAPPPSGRGRGRGGRGFSGFGGRGASGRGGFGGRGVLPPAASK